MNHPEWEVGTRVKVVKDFGGEYMLRGATGVVVEEECPVWKDRLPYMITVEPDKESIEKGLAQKSGLWKGWNCKSEYLERIEEEG